MAEAAVRGGESLQTQASGLQWTARARGTGARNRALGPRYRSLDVYVHRRLALPVLRWVAVPLGLDITISGENLLASSSHVTVGSITSWAFFDVPYAAHAGRSIRGSARFMR